MNCEKTKRKNNTDKIVISMILAIFFLFLILGGLLFVYDSKENSEEKPISQKLNFEDKVYYKISSEFELNEKDGEGSFEIILDENNQYYINVEIFDSEENYIGETNSIYPHDEKQKIIFDLKDVNYDSIKEGTAVINAYNSETSECCGKTTEKISFNVKKKGR